MNINVTSGRFTIEFPGPTLKIRDGGLTGMSIHELHELGYLVQTALQVSGNEKRAFKPYEGGNPSQINDPINAQPET